jgi:hypothetical protein
MGRAMPIARQRVAKQVSAKAYLGTVERLFLSNGAVKIPTNFWEAVFSVGSARGYIMRNSRWAGAHAGSSHADFSTMKMEVIRFSETSVHTRSTGSHIPEGGILYNWSCCQIILLPTIISQHNENKIFQFSQCKKVIMEHSNASLDWS